GYDQQHIRDFLLRTIECAENACFNREQTLIAGGIGPYGAYLCDGSEYRGEYKIDRRELIDFHRERYEILSQSYCDLIVFETIPCLEEVDAIVEFSRDSSKPVWVSMCCRNGSQLSSGEPLAEAGQRLAAAPSIVAVGVNCVAPQNVASQIEVLQDV